MSDDMPMTDRMEAIQLLNVLLDNTKDSFDPALAARLIELIPVTDTKPSTDITIWHRLGRKGGTSGVSPGFGEVHVSSQDDEPKKLGTVNNFLATAS